MKINIKLLNIIKRKSKYVDFFLDIEPRSKKVSKNKSDLQNLFIEKMKARGLQKIKGEVAIEITVYTKEKTPPQIERVVKNICDLIHNKNKTLKNQADEIYLPIEDDKYIKYLRAKYVFLDVTSQIHLKIRPFSSFTSDINFVGEEIGVKYRENSNISNDNWNEYKELINNKDKIIKMLSEEAYNAMLKLKILDLQKELCNLMSITPEIISLIYPKKSKYINKIKDIYKSWASMNLDTPIIIHLPGIPLKNGEEKDYKNRYKENIKKQMVQYLERNPIFDKFQSPILISTFYLPPKKKKKNYKDIDNIMLEYIMPAMNKVFRPPISLFNIGMEDRSSNEVREKSITIPKSLNGSAIGYEVIELPHNFANTDTGFLKIGFKIEDVESSIMEYIDDQIDKYMSKNRYMD
jgi:hypothetical protein